MKISVSMIALNEAKNIARGLSCCTFADEIVVVDGGSTDGTLNTLKGHERVVLIQHPWEDHFGKQRQVSLGHCTGDWVVRLDADEVFSREFEENIRQALELIPPDTVGCRIRQCNLVGNENFYAKIFDDYENMPRIWRNLPGIRWEGQVHEILSGLKGNIGNWDAYVVHYGFLDKKRYWEKGILYSKIPDSKYTSPGELVYREYDIQPRPYRSRVSLHVPPYIPDEENNERPRVAIVRGPNLNPWEMQNYEPLADRFGITAYTTTQPNFDLSIIKLPVVKLPPALDNPAYMIGLEAELFDKDVIFTADITWTFTYQACLAKQKFGKKVVAIEWENIPFAYEEDEGMKALKQANRQWVDLFIAVTQRAKDALIIEGVPEDKIRVIPMGIDIDRFRPDEAARWKLRKELGIGRGEQVVLFTGRMVWEKGIYDYLYAAKLLLSGSDIKEICPRFIVIGKGPEHEGVKKRAAELGILSSFLFIEDWPYQRMHEMFNMADIFVLPSINMRTWKEQFGMVLIEAMACGLPVISTLSGSIPEVVGDAGILIQPNDPGSLCLAIKGLLHDADRRRDLKEKGRKRAVQEFDSKKIAKRYGDLFEDLAGSSFRGALCELARYTGLSTDKVIERIRGVYAQQMDEWRELSKGELTQERINRFYRDTDSYLFDLVQYNYENPEYLQWTSEIEQFCRRIASERDGLNLLDFGGGIGSQLINLSRIKGIRLAYADIPGRTFHYAKWRFKEKGLDVEMMDAGKEGFLGTSRFDVVIMMDVVEHLIEPEKIVRYLIDHMNTNGYLLMVASFIDNNGEAGWHLNVDRYTNEGFYKIIKDMGLEMLNDGPLRVFRKAFEDSSDLTVTIDSTLREEKFEEARILIESYMGMRPLDLPMLFKYAEVCSKLCDYPSALESLEKLLLFDRDNPRALELRGEIEKLYLMHS